MITHLLTEADCETFREKLLAKADEAVGTSAHSAWTDAVQLLDTARSESFRRRAKLPAIAAEEPPVATPRKVPALASTSDDEL